MLEDLLECSKNDDELIAFLLEYANYFDEKDLETIKEIQENESDRSNIYKEISIDSSNNVNASNSFDKVELKISLDNNTESKKIIRLKAKPNTIINKRNKILVHKIVKDGIDTYINPICVKAYRKLLDRNIFVKDVSVNELRVRIILDKLSNENENIFKKGCLVHPKKYKRIGNNNVIEIQRESKSDSTIKNELVKSIRFLKMQDVQTGFIDKKRFLMNFCDCEKVEGHIDFKYNKNIKIIFDESKMEKTFEEYLADKKFDKLYSQDNNKVYLDEFYLNAHLKYLDYMNNIDSNNVSDNDEINSID